MGGLEGLTGGAEYARHDLKCRLATDVVDPVHEEKTAMRNAHSMAVRPGTVGFAKSVEGPWWYLADAAVRLYDNRTLDGEGRRRGSTTIF
jgi:hypothetical protein